MFPVREKNPKLATKDLIIGITIDGVAKAYPLSAVNGLREPIKDKISGVDILVHPAQNSSVYITDNQGNLLPGVVAYWFDWSSFHKNTFVYHK